MDLDLVTSLTQEGPAFQGNWANFLVNVDQAMYLKNKKDMKKEDILAVLMAGQRFTGTGWTTGRASKKLFDLSGVGIVKSSIDCYRDCWLYAVAMLTGVHLPLVELAPDCAEAAFNLVAYLEQPTEGQGHPVTVNDSESESDDDFKFAWDEPTTPAPRELQAL